MPKKDDSAKQDEVDSLIHNKIESPKQDKTHRHLWADLERNDFYNISMIIIMIITLLGGANFFGYAINIGDELNYQRSCELLTEDCKYDVNAFEGERVKFTGKIIDDESANDVRILFLQPDGCSETDRICVMMDADERNGVEGDLVTVYGFLYGTHLSSRPGYYVPLIISKYINIQESKY